MAPVFMKMNLVLSLVVVFSPLARCMDGSFVRGIVDGELTNGDFARRMENQMRGFDSKTGQVDGADESADMVTGIEAVNRIISHQKRKLQDDSACPQAEEFNRNNAQLEVEIVAPSGIVLTQGGASTADVEVIGHANIGVGDRVLHFTYVIDRSGSTSGNCEPGKSILDCEKEAILGLHANIVQDDSAVDYGVSFFGNSGETSIFSGSPLPQTGEARPVKLRLP